jgi:hypothetical protein
VNALEKLPRPGIHLDGVVIVVLVGDPDQIDSLAVRGKQSPRSLDYIDGEVGIATTNPESIGHHASLNRSPDDVSRALTKTRAAGRIRRCQDGPGSLRS